MARGQRDRESRAIDFVRELESLDDGELLQRLRHVVVKERRSTTQLLAHLAVLDGRRLFISMGYSSLFNYCTRGLHFSEQAAYLRIEAARVVRRFPAVLARVAEGSIHLTALSLLRPHLTTGNYRSLLDAACHRSRREVEDLVAVFRCGPASPPRPRFNVVPPPGTPDASFGRSPDPLSPTVDSSRFGDTLGGSTPGVNRTEPGPLSPLSFWSSPAEADDIIPHAGEYDLDPVGRTGEAGGDTIVPACGGAGGDTNDSALVTAEGGARGDKSGPARVSGGAGASLAGFPGSSTQYYRLHLTISSETRLKLEQARELLRHQVPDGDPAKILDRALGVLLDRLEQRKFARLMARPTPAIGIRSAVEPPLPQDPKGSPTASQSASPAGNAGTAQGSRDIPAAVRRDVWYRDNGQCAFVGDDGVRCDCRDGVEYHHLIPWATGGAATPENLSLRCQVHNAWESEIAFARSPVAPGDDPRGEAEMHVSAPLMAGPIETDQSDNEQPSASPDNVGHGWNSNDGGDPTLAQLGPGRVERAVPGSHGNDTHGGRKESANDGHGRNTRADCGEDTRDKCGEETGDDGGAHTRGRPEDNNSHKADHPPG